MKPDPSAEARARILGRLRAAAPAAVPAAPDLAAHYARHAGPSESDDFSERIRRFAAAIEAAHAELHRVTDATLADTLAAVIRAKTLRSVAVGNRVLGDPALIDPLTRATRVVPFVEPVETLRAELFHEIDAGLSVARSAIAETGTLILWPGADEPRLVSLVPPVHIVLLDAALIHDSLFVAMRAEGWAWSLPTNALLISGPSKTADIQQTLAYGAHGPKELVVLLRLPQEER